MAKKYWLIIMTIVFIAVGFFFYFNYRSSEEKSVPNVKTNELKNNNEEVNNGSIPLEKPPFLNQ